MGKSESMFLFDKALYRDMKYLFVFGEIESHLV